MNDLRLALRAVLGPCQPRVTRAGSGIALAVQLLRAAGALAGTFVPFPSLKTGESHRGPVGVKMSPLSPIALLCALWCKAAFLVCGTEGEPRDLLLLLPGEATAPTSSNDFFKGSKSLMLWLPICKNTFMMQKLLVL